jgi:hypothetical protein
LAATGFQYGNRRTGQSNWQNPTRDDEYWDSFEEGAILEMRGSRRTLLADPDSKCMNTEADLNLLYKSQTITLARSMTVVIGTTIIRSEYPQKVTKSG